MPYTSGKLKGELTIAELRRLVAEHNRLMSLKIPPKTDRAGIIALIKKNGYDVDHAKARLVPRVKMKRKPVVKLQPAQAKPRGTRRPKKVGVTIETQTAPSEEMIRLGFTGPMGQLGSGGGGSWTIDDEIGLMVE